MIGNELIHRRNKLLFTLMGSFYFVQVTINILFEGITSVFPPVILFSAMGVLLFASLKKLNPRVTMYMIVCCTYVYFVFLLNDSPYLVNYLFMWLGLPLSAIYQNHKVVLLAFLASMFVNYYTFFFLHEEIFPNVVREDFIYMVLFGVFVTIFLLTFIHMTLRLWQEAREANEKLQKLAYHDPLTGAANRLLLKKKFEEWKEGEPNSIAILFLDMNNFKYINDTFGHEVGDQILEAVVLRVRGVLGETDLLCRLGGDEFVIMVTNAKHTEFVHLLKLVQSSLEQPLSIHQYTLKASASIGFSYSTDIAHVDLEELIREADADMYLEKQSGPAV